MSGPPLRGFGQGMAAYSSGAPGSPCDLDLARTDYPPLLDSMTRLSALALTTTDGYPDAAELTAAVASRFGVIPDRVLITAGADDALARVVRATLAPGVNAILTSPTFEMLPRFVTQAGAEGREVPWGDAPIGLAALQPLVDRNTALIIIVSPNNPTGVVLPLEQLRDIALSYPEQVLLVDLAYVEFAVADPTAALLELPNVVITRTFSKSWGLAGMRVGYAIGSPDLITAMRRAGLPYPVSAPALRLASALWSDREVAAALTARRTIVTAHRALLSQHLRDLGFTPCPSEGNFVTTSGPRARWLADALAGAGIAVRLLTSAAGDFLRMTVPLEAESLDRVLVALSAAAAPEALLFDLDGVLADVSRSYREAIILTAADFGVTVASADVQALKALGNANDDWQVTSRLIALGGGQATLAEVTARFEERYQGTKAESGLYQRESLLTTRHLLAQLAQRFPLAIVTGRPRADAQRFLNAWGIADLFRVVVTREDAPLKPNPAPLELAMRALGTRRVWMIGDTPDDLRAARACGAIPIGIVAPGEDPLTAIPTLQHAGAARVLTTLEELVPCLP